MHVSSFNLKWGHHHLGGGKRRLILHNAHIWRWFWVKPLFNRKALFPDQNLKSLMINTLCFHLQRLNRSGVPALFPSEALTELIFIGRTLLYSSLTFCQSANRTRCTSMPLWTATNKYVLLVNVLSPACALPAADGMWCILRFPKDCGPQKPERHACLRTAKCERMQPDILEFLEGVDVWQPEYWHARASLNNTVVLVPEHGVDF